jgi:hypothetical protein
MTGAGEQGFEFQIQIDAPTEVVWRALRDPAEIRRWHGWQFDGLDEEIALVFGEKNTTSEEGKWLELQGSDRFTLSDVDGATLLRLTRAPRGNNPEWDAYYEDINEGWTTFMHQLRFALERHRGEERATVYLTSEGTRGAARELAARVGAGERYEVEAPTGERLSGELWFRSANQVGVTVESWGDGLLIIGQHPTSVQHPQGGDMVLLTAYGLDAEAFSRLEAGWTQWWGADE